MYLIEETKSSLIKQIEYHEDEKELIIRFVKYYVDELTYINVPLTYFMQFSNEKSMGKYYLNMIKPRFKTKNNYMSNETENGKKQPKRINKASDQKRFIKMRINVLKFNKDFFFIGEKGDVYADITLQLLPDGETDKYGQLGMVTQDVPKTVWEKEKGNKSKTQGAILGNGIELDWEQTAQEGAPGSDAGVLATAAEGEDWKDDLPF